MRGEGLGVRGSSGTANQTCSSGIVWIATEDGGGRDAAVQADEEQALVLACQHGDLSAYERLVRAYQDAALRSAFLLTGNRQAAEDVAQNAFLQVFRHLARFDTERAFRPWFFGILAKEARQHLRRQRRQPTVAWSLSSDALDGACVDPLLDGLIRNDERAQVRAALAALGEPFRTTAILYYVNNLAVDEVATALGCRVGTVKSRLHTARKRLRAALATQAAPGASNQIAG
jgi:RNA polymerase sigma factor (sigma-70 family)